MLMPEGIRLKRDRNTWRQRKAERFRNKTKAKMRKKERVREGEWLRVKER